MLSFIRTIKCAAAAFVAAAMLMVATLPSQADTGTVRFRVGSAGFIVGVGGGSGTLTFHGKTYPLRISGVSLGMIGVSSADLVGRARNLRRASDIAGSYTAVGAGLAVAGGASTARMQNANGVVLEVRGTKVGFSASLDLSGLTISMQ
ncbi:MAG TPA: hypothetical protein VL305_06200 [Pseudolabrys sp.]|jgi:hypothetical protein|nr:hypothetical protein [Pseudolabrys sp.]